MEKWGDGEVGSGDAGTWGRGDAGTWGRGDAGTRGITNDKSPLPTPHSPLPIPHSPFAIPQIIKDAADRPLHHS
ncbi:MAG: hypothetical protein RMY29_030325 [Nostoc sp. CreGUA01]|nr:hypothetical protein [Nostoc sp. CreGUA01]